MDGVVDVAVDDDRSVVVARGDDGEAVESPRVFASPQPPENCSPQGGRLWTRAPELC